MTMSVQRALPTYLLFFLAFVSIFGCGEKAALPSLTAEIASLSPAQKLVFLTNKANKGNAEAQNALGSMYAEGKDIPRDYAKGVEWNLKAAAQNNTDAQLFLFMSYKAGHGVPRDDAKAQSWLQKSAENENTFAQMILSSAYEEGDGVQKDAQKSVAWLRKAAVTGEGLAQANLGVRYLNGTAETPKDLVLAYAWLNLLGGGGSMGDLRDKLGLRLSKVELTEAQRLSSNWKKGKDIARE
jgi:TPR repeat protein